MSQCRTIRISANTRTLHANRSACAPLATISSIPILACPRLTPPVVPHFPPSLFLCLTLASTTLSPMRHVSCSCCCCCCCGTTQTSTAADFLSLPFGVGMRRRHRTWGREEFPAWRYYGYGPCCPLLICVVRLPVPPTILMSKGTPDTSQLMAWLDSLWRHRAAAATPSVGSSSFQSAGAGWT